MRKIKAHQAFLSRLGPISSVPNRLRALREAQGLSLVQLASLVGTTNQQLSHLELGKRQLTVDWLQRLAKALNCHPWAIISPDVPATSEEAELLGYFRRLSPEGRGALLSELHPVSKPARSPKLQRS